MVVDDDPEFRQMIQVSLRAAGYEVVTAPDALSALRVADNHRPDAILLDIMMPQMDGFDACARLRELTEAPIIFTTARGNIEDIVKGFSVGADDYLVKPFRMEVLTSRLRACLRRASRSQSTEEAVLYPADWFVLDCGRHELHIDGRDIYLTPREFEVLRVLIQHVGTVLSVDAILSRIESADDLSPDLVKQYIYRLRKKIEPDPANPRYLHTVWGVGYYFDLGDSV
jgi:two-component system KDP operon response regulator KdpE